MSIQFAQLINDIVKQMRTLCEALEQRAEELRQSGKEPEVAKKLALGADTMRDSGNLYITWARHYAALAEGNPEASDQDEESDIGVGS